MTSGFVWHRRSKRAIATFSVFEADLLRFLAGQLVELLHHESAVPAADLDPLEALLDFSGPTTAPSDPVLRRLLPDAYRGDDEAAGEFRRFTEGGLRESKSRTASVVVDVLEDAGLPDDPGEEDLTIDVELDEAGAMAWMRALTDLRLALAARIEIEEGEEEFWEELPDEDPRAQGYRVYEWLGFVQETLVRAVDR